MTLNTTTTVRSSALTRTTRSLLAAGLIASLAACGSTSPMDDGPDAGDSSGADAGDSNYPTVMVSPSNGERGILADDPLILTFSEPMNTASVEAAWTSTSLPKGDMVFSWNAAKTILTVDASAAIEYPAGDETVDRYDYDIVLESAASSEAGDELEAKLTSSFASARDVTMQLVRVDATTGSYDSGAYGTDIRVGDTDSNGTWRGFITIDLSALPTVVEITEASLFARQTDVVLHPYLDLGNIKMLHMAPITDAIDFLDYSNAGSNVGTFSDSEAQANPGGNRSIDVTSNVVTDLAAGSTISSFRLEFENAHDNENDTDHAIFDRTSVRLDVRLLAE